MYIQQIYFNRIYTKTMYNSTRIIQSQRDWANIGLRLKNTTWKCGYSAPALKERSTVYIRTDSCVTAINFQNKTTLKSEPPSIPEVCGLPAHLLPPLHHSPSRHPAAAPVGQVERTRWAAVTVATGITRAHCTHAARTYVAKGVPQHQRGERRKKVRRGGQTGSLPACLPARLGPTPETRTLQTCAAFQLF